MHNNQFKNKVVVTSCLGGSQGDIGVVRSLGRAGIKVILLTEYATSLSRFSRYVERTVVEPEMTRSRAALKKALLDIAAAEEHKPVLFPTADPDLTLLSELKNELSPHFHEFLSHPQLIEVCLDKGKFFEFSRDLGFPIPNTHCPRNIEEVKEIAGQQSFPAILKPLVPQTWSQPKIQRLVDEKKALVINSAAELCETYEKIATLNSDMAIQDYIPGRDDRLYSLHIYVSRAGEVLGYFTGQKIRTFPTYAGIGCFVRSVYVPEIVDSGIDILRKLNYTGMALLQFKQDSRDGQYKLLEINPRASSWNILAERCGVNLAEIAYRDTLGESVVSRPTQMEGINYLYFGHDFRAFLDYRKHGDWSWFSWLRSLLGPKVFQLWCSDDPGPFWRSQRVFFGRVLKKVRKPMKIKSHAAANK